MAIKLINHLHHLEVAKEHKPTLNHDATSVQLFDLMFIWCSMLDNPNHSDLFDPKTCSTLLNIKNVLIGCDCVMPHLVRHPIEFQKFVIQSDTFDLFFKF